MTSILQTEILLSIQESLQGISHVVRIVSAMKEFSHPGQANQTLYESGTVSSKIYYRHP